jgi:hypothetical protein
LTLLAFLLDQLDLLLLLFPVLLLLLLLLVCMALRLRCVALGWCVKEATAARGAAVHAWEAVVLWSLLSIIIRLACL